MGMNFYMLEIPQVFTVLLEFHNPECHSPIFLDTYFPVYQKVLSTLPLFLIFSNIISSYSPSPNCISVLCLDDVMERGIHGWLEELTSGESCR